MFDMWLLAIVIIIGGLSVAATLIAVLASPFFIFAFLAEKLGEKRNVARRS